MQGFKEHDAATRFCREHGKLRNLLRSRRRQNQIVSASLRRFRFARDAQIVLGIMQKYDPTGSYREPSKSWRDG